MDINENVPSEEQDDTFFIVEGSDSDEIIEKLKDIFKEFPEGFLPDGATVDETMEVFYDSDGKVDTQKLEDFFQTEILFNEKESPSSQEEGTTPDFLNYEDEPQVHPLAFLEEKEVHPLTAEDQMDLKKLDTFFKECAKSNAEKETLPAPSFSHDLPLPLEEVQALVERCENFMEERFPHWRSLDCESTIQSIDIAILGPSHNDTLVEYLQQGKVYVDFNPRPTDYISGLHLYQKAFPELNLLLPPAGDHPLYFENTLIPPHPQSESFKLGMFYYDLGEISFRSDDKLTFFSCVVASSYYNYPLGNVVLKRTLAALRFKNLTQETPRPILKSKKGLLLAGHCYLTGIGSVCNEEQAFLMYEKLSQEKNSPRGKIALAMCYLDGIWVEPNQDIAIRLLKEAVELGNQTALYQLIFTYLLDETEDSSLEKAVELSKHPLIHGQELSCFLLSLFYTYGIGTEADVDRGLYFFEKSGNYEIQTLGHPLRVRIMDLI